MRVRKGDVMSKNFTKETIEKLADLLMIGLTEEETKSVLDEFEVIDANINKINNIKGIEDVEPMTHCLDDFVCELRDDIVEESIPLEDLLKNSDEVEDGEVSVPKVVS